MATAGAQVRESMALSAEADVPAVLSGIRPRAVLVAADPAADDVAVVLAGLADRPDAAAPVVRQDGPAAAGLGRRRPTRCWPRPPPPTATAAAGAGGGGGPARGDRARRRPGRLAAARGLRPQPGAGTCALPGGRHPRANLWALLVPLLLAAGELGLMPRARARPARRPPTCSTRWPSACRPGSDTYVNPAKSLALDLAESVPVVVGSTPAGGAAAHRLVGSLAAAGSPGRLGVLPVARTRLAGLLTAPTGPAPTTTCSGTGWTTRPRPGPGWCCVRAGDEPDVARAQVDELVADCGRRGVPVSEVCAEDAAGPVGRLASVLALLDFTAAYVGVAGARRGGRMSAEGGTRAILAALGANLGIAVAKFVGFAITGSSSMLAEGAHSVADSGNQVLLLVGGRRARRAATAEHPFGYGRDRYFYAFVVALVLFTLGSLFSLYEGYHKLRDHEATLDRPQVAIVILLVAMGLEGFSLRTAVVESNQVRGDSSWFQFIRRAKAPELPVVLLEDTAALLGLVFALAGVGLSWATGDTVWDGVATC